MAPVSPLAPASFPALPAIAATLERLPSGAAAGVFLEVEDEQDRQPLDGPEGTDITWVHREGRPYGQGLAEVVRAAEFPTGDVQVFVHGNKTIIFG